MCERAILEQAIQKYWSEFFNNANSSAKIFRQIQLMKEKLGHGYMFVSFGEYSLIQNLFSFPNVESAIVPWKPESFWLNEKRTYALMPNKVATALLEYIKSDPCQPGHETIIISAFIDRGSNAVGKRYEIAFVRHDVLYRSNEEID